MQIDHLDLFLTQYARYGQSTSNDTYWHVFAEDICTALTSYGHHTLVATAHANDGKKLMQEMLTTEIFPKSILTFNFLPYVASADISFLDIVKTPVIGIFLDHPVHVYLQTIQSYKNYRQFHYAVMAEQHIAFLVEMGVPKSNIFALHHGGPNIYDDAKPLKDRTNDIVFFGRIDDHISINKLAQDHGLKSPEEIADLKQLCSDFLNCKVDLYAATQAYLNKHGLNENWSLHKQVFFARIVDQRARIQRRMLSFGKLSDLNIHYYGTFSESFKKLSRNATFHESVSFKEAITIMKDTKIVLSDNILDEAVITRPFYGMASQALIASQYNSVLSNHFNKNEHMLDLDAPDILKQIKDVLQNPEKAQPRVESTSKIYKEHFTFEKTCLALHEYLSKLQK